MYLSGFCFAKELFEDRRRGKTSVSSDGGSEVHQSSSPPSPTLLSLTQQIVPQSPRRPGPKSLLQNSSNPSRQPILKTPTPTASAKTLKASSLPLQSPHTVAAQKPSGNNGASTPSSASVVQPPHAYAVAAGGNQTPHPASTPLTPQPPSVSSANSTTVEFVFCIEHSNASTLHVCLIIIASSVAIDTGITARQ